VEAPQRALHSAAPLLRRVEKAGVNNAAQIDFTPNSRLHATLAATARSVRRRACKKIPSVPQ
jgi:hypothetical protein